LARYSRTLTKTLKTLKALIVLSACACLAPVSAQNAALKYKPETMAFLTQGTELLRQNKLKAAREKFEKVVALEPGIPDGYNNLGLTYAYDGQLDKAVANYRRALDIEPLYATALNNLAVVLYAQGKAEEALYYWRLCLKVTPGSLPELNYHIANALRDTGNKVEARKHYQEALKGNTAAGRAAALSGLAALDLSEGKLDDAFKHISQSIKLNGDSSFAYYHLGLIQEKRGHVDKAIAAFKNSLKYEESEAYIKETKERIARLSGQSGPTTNAVQPNLAQPNAIADAIKKKSWAEAVALIEAKKASGQNTEDPVLENNLGLCLANLNQLNKAVECYRKAIMLKKEAFPEAQFNLGMALRKGGDTLASEAAFRKAIDDSAQLKKTNPLAQNMLAITLRERGDYPGADRAFRRAIMQSGGDLPVAHYNLAVLLERVDRTREAVQEYKTYLKLAPKGKNAQLARGRLRKLGVAL
jgi:tetratricopeptide (TPR) repeat protein